MSIRSQGCYCKLPSQKIAKNDFLKLHSSIEKSSLILHDKKKGKDFGPNVKHVHGPQGTTHSMVPLRHRDLDSKFRVQNVVLE